MRNTEGVNHLSYEVSQWATSVRARQLVGETFPRVLSGFIKDTIHPNDSMAMKVLKVVLGP